MNKSNKIALTNIAIASQINLMKPLLENAFITKFQEVQEGTYKLTIGKHTLILSDNAFYSSKFSVPAVERPKNSFALSLNKRISNQKVFALRQQNFDRLIVFDLQKYNLILEFMNNFNIILIDKNFKIVNCFAKNPERGILVHNDYSFPKSSRISPEQLTLEAFTESILNSDKALIKQLTLTIDLPGFLLEDLIAQANLDKMKAANQTHKEKIKSLFNLIKKTPELAKSQEAYLIEGKVDFISSIKLLASKSISCEKPLNDFLDEFYSSKLSTDSINEAATTFNEKLIKTELTLKQQLEAKINFEKEILEAKEKANLIKQNYAEIEEILSTCKINLSKKEQKLNLSKINPRLTKVDESKKKIYLVFC